MSFQTLLIANRGEIACRIQRTAHRLGYRTVAVYSDADAGAPHVLMADAAVRIGPPPSAQSYLHIEALLDAARRTGADAVHPGYGFLSERADFAQACLDAGLVFIGPPPAAIRAMGDKAQAKRRMQQAGIPCAPGYLGAEQGDDRLGTEAARLGLPLLVKAVAGGGGRGMRLVHTLNELPAALATARREAEAAFGDGTLMLERLVEHGRHIEVQVFCDHHGHAVHLGERDCTAQRRHQKVIEEAPSPVVDAEMRARLGADAVAAALAVGYQGAGTVEFIVDAGLRHHFLEMNTRLQVEHTVTECLTGLDLVEWQLRIARGEPLPLQQAQITFSGHAIEARLCAEDPCDDWRPQTGRIAGWAPEAAGIRIDHGIAAGGEVTPWYDAMLAKFVVHGSDRDDAIRRLRRALAQAPLLGVATNARFLQDLLTHADFAGAAMTTTRLDEWAATAAPILQRQPPTEDAWRLAAGLLSPGTGTRPASVAGHDLTLACQGTLRRLRAPVEGVALTGWAGTSVRCVIDGVHRHAHAVIDDGVLHLALDGSTWAFTEPVPWSGADPGIDTRRARSPVAGVVARVSVAAGDTVSAGQPLLCLEAMKMEMWLHAGADGTVSAVHARPGDSVARGAVLVELELPA